MARRLPQLNALRAFEAAARQLSFTKAAAELSVTQAAISHQVKALEEELGVKLFRRLNRALALTDAGQAYLPPTRAAFETIAHATAKLRTREAGGPLKVSMLPSFGARWLMPRLWRFRERHPEIDVLVSVSNAPVDFARDDMDMAIRYGYGRYPDLHATLLMREQIYPVCSPRLLATGPGIRTPDDLRHYTLLHDYAAGIVDEHAWPYWLKQWGVAGFDWERGPAFSDSAMLVLAAVEGHGVALGRESLCADDVAAGRLVRLFPELPFETRTAYYVVSPPANAEQPKVRRFRDWLLEEAGAMISAEAALPAPGPPTRQRASERR